jgi:hypothetical protein
VAVAAAARPRLQAREPLMRRAAAALMWTQAGWTVVLILYALFGKGRPEANNHPVNRAQVGPPELWY